MFTSLVKRTSLLKKYETPVKLVALTGVNLVFTLLINYLLADQITPEEYGAWRLFLTLTSFSGLLHFGLVDGMTIQWLFSSTKDWQSSSKRDFSYLLIQQVLIYFLLITAIGKLFPQLKTVPYAPILLANQVVLQNVSGLLQAFFNRSEKFYYGSSFTLISQLAFCFGLMLYRFNFLPGINLNLLSNIQIAIATFSMLYLLHKHTINWPSLTRYDLHPQRFIAVIKKSIGLGLPILLTGLLFLGFQNIDKLLISKYYSPRQFGFYAFAGALLNVVLTIVVSISNFLMQKLVSIRHSIELYYDSAVMLILKLDFLLLVGALPARLFINQLLPVYSESAVYITYLSGFVAPYLLVQLIQFTIFKILNKQRQFFALAIMVFGSTAVLLVALASHHAALTIMASVSTFMAYIWFAAGDWLLCSVKRECKANQTKRYAFMITTICLYLLLFYLG
ncbi:oligosaccharide flippase family protein [Larkinella terrae]|uniref:Oligosaccharide flippase family protein n=1 Tax=Larkinella terrae TaxID=2025311 RepID=A0A7K0EGJ4_9BACT|nr:oligosaccharide flippase family protein [Larkinella terrae]MRS60937.1 oligosaccharide flippase family protein [Larkinella terrae]